MKKYKMLFLIMLSLFGLCSCTEKTNINGIIFESIECGPFTPTEDAYLHYDLNVDSCPNYEHYKILNFVDVYTTTQSTGKHHHTIKVFEGITIKTINGRTIFLSKNQKWKIYVDECPYCKGD